jgi:hypothetical protein
MQGLIDLRIQPVLIVLKQAVVTHTEAVFVFPGRVHFGYNPVVNMAESFPCVTDLCKWVSDYGKKVFFVVSQHF